MTTAIDTSALSIEVLAPSLGPRPLDDVLAPRAGSHAPFADTRRQTLSALSQCILHDPRLRADAACVALSYWLRKTNITRLAERFARRQELSPETVWIPSGRVFHVAPANVDTVFLYSWALAYLCGNQSIVRVSSDRGEVLTRLLETLSELMQTDPALAAGNWFVTYPHNAEVSTALSLWATHRVVWGGDETVRSLRDLPLSPHASERAFGSKFSFGVVSSDAYFAADERTVQRLAAGFFTDVFTFEQMACSSPHLFLWKGSAEQTEAALARFDDALAAEIDRRHYHGSPSSAVHRLNFAFDMACEVEVSGNFARREFFSGRLAETAPAMKTICGAGFLTHKRINRLSEVADWVDERDQTITHFGFSDSELRELAVLVGARGADRLVPVGEALAFEPIWDGYDLIADFTRQVTVRQGAEA